MHTKNLYPYDNDIKDCASWLKLIICGKISIYGDKNINKRSVKRAGKLNNECKIPIVPAI